MKKKKIILGLALGLTFGISTIAYATTTYDKVIPILFSDAGTGSIETGYGTADIDGRYREEHSYVEGNPTSGFKAVLYYRTPFYKPNQARDSSTHIDGYNETSCAKGDEFKVVMDATWQFGANKWTRIHEVQFTK